MCGIFGIVAGPQTPLSREAFDRAVTHLFLRSEERGKEAAGLAVMANEEIGVFKYSQRPTEMLRKPNYRRFYENVMGRVFADGSEHPAMPFACIGHSRLVTNGIETLDDNNQPVTRPHVVGVHNGIIVNIEELWTRHADLGRRCELDSEAIFAMIETFGPGSIADGLAYAFGQMEGSASIGMLFDDGRTMALASNTGSLYIAVDKNHGFVVFASERFTLDVLFQEAALKEFRVHCEITQVGPMAGASIDVANFSVNRFEIGEGPSKRPAAPTGGVNTFNIVNHTSSTSHLRRCTRCILPETFPFISFDEHGVCSVCNGMMWRESQGREALDQALEKYRRTDGEADSLIAFSGGRDSAYGLHYVVKELGMRPIAYTYDWGMVTPLARRNQARLVGKLGIEHIIRSPDIRAKRRYIRQNLQAWLRRPDLGMIPLFSAGDKQFYKYGRQLRDETGLKLTFFCSGNELERTEFKTGFCGVQENAHGMRLNAYTIENKIKFLIYYAKQYMINYKYFNSSLIDIMASYKDTFIDRDDFIYVYHFIDWDEKEIVDTLVSEYDWEFAEDTETTWRIDDAFTPFHNYVYHTVAGFSEHDTFRSNQVRRSLISRDEALRLAEEENRPRIRAMRDYAEMIGINLEEVMLAINSIPKLYD